MEKRKPTVQERRARGKSITDHLEMQIPAQSEWVRVVRLATAGVASRIGFSYEEIEDIKLAITEACNNAILHSCGTGTTDANADDARARITSPSTTTTTESQPQPVVKICWKVFEDGICVSVTDEGRLESVEALRRAPEIPSNEKMGELHEDGMGLLLIESVMDEIEHEVGHHINTTLHMTKYLQKYLQEPEQDTAVRNARSTRSYPDPDSPVDIGVPRKRVRARSKTDSPSMPEH